MPRTATDNARTPPASPVRARILDAAAALFRQNGFDVSMEAIAQVAGVAKQSLYNHFGSKEELFRSIIAQRSQALRAELLEDAAPRAPRDVLLAFAAQYQLLVLDARGTGFLRMVVAASQRFPEVGAEFFDAGPAQTAEVLARWMERQSRLGRLGVADPRLAAEHFLSLLHGQALLKGLLGLEDAYPTAGLEARAAFCVDLFLGGLARMSDQPPPV